ncbi:hypothetical protein MD484_g1303, partial [Candolleomyces efflorescens]
MSPITPSSIDLDRAAANRLYNDNHGDTTAQLLKSSFTKSSDRYPGKTPYSVITEGCILKNGMPRLVVLKTFRGHRNTPLDKIAQRTSREVQAWAQLAKSATRCDNINTFHGVVFIGSDVVQDVVDASIPSIVTDFVRYDAVEYTTSRNFAHRLEIVRQLANGVSHMHSLNLVHGDLKPDNVRVTEEGVVKIIDLGLTPELIREEEEFVFMSVTKQTDVYAFSMTALQILDGQGERSLPFNNIRVAREVRVAVLNSQWPERHRYGGVLPGAWEIISSCWTEPSRRLSIEALLKALSTY